MIVTVTPEKINIQNDNYHCTFSDETLERLSSGGLTRRCKVTYKLFINHRELQLECPLLKHPQHKNIVLWPAIKLPYRKYPVYVYLYAVALYLSTDLSMRSVVAEVRKIFGLDGFSHSTLCRTLKKLGEMPGDFSFMAIIEKPPLVVRKGWDPARQEQYRLLLGRLSPVLDNLQTIAYSSLLNYRHFNNTQKFLL